MYIFANSCKLPINIYGNVNFEHSSKTENIFILMKHVVIYNSLMCCNLGISRNLSIDV